MLKRLSVLATLLFATVSLAGDTAYVPASGSGSSSSSSAAAFTACATGTVRGFGYDDTTGLYQATCGNYNWSAESGGFDAATGLIPDYTQPTTVGGNGEYITCTGPGVGVADDGSVYDSTVVLESGTCASGTNTTTAKCAEASTSITPANQYRDRVIKLLVGPGAGDIRRIASDANVSARHDWTITADRVFSADPDGTTFEVYDDLGSVCHAAGERIKLNYMADAMLAQDHTVPGGKVYFPKFEGYDHAIYVDRGCGRKSSVAVGTSGNFCPVLKAPLDDHYQRSLQAFRRVNWVSEGVDPDGWENGRKAVWHVDDLGGSRTANRGYDPSDGTTALHNWTFKSGLASNQSRLCTPQSTTDPRCSPDASQNQEVGDSAWGRVFQFTHAAQVTYGGFLCVSDTMADSGTCRGDRRIACTTTGARATTTTGGCDFGAGGDLGPCEDARDAIEYEVETLGKDLKILATWNLYEFPEVSTQQVTQTADFFSIKDVPGTTGAPQGGGAGCAAGSAYISVPNASSQFSGWPFGKSKLETADTSKDFVVLDWERYYNEGGGWTGGTFTPNQWYGRDLDASGTSDPGDCLSGGNPNETADENACDYNALMGLQSSFSGGLDGIVVANGSSSYIDGSVSGINTKLYNSLIINGKRGVWGDASNWDIDNNTWLNNFGENSGLNVNFTHAAILKNQRFIGNHAPVIIGTNHGKGMTMDGLFFQGNSGVLIAANHASDMTISNVIAYGNTAALLVLYPQFPMNGFSMHHVRAYSQGNVGGSSVYGRALIHFGRLGSTTATNETIRNFNFSDIHLESPTNDSCLFYFDDAQGADNATINVNRTQFAISDSSIDALNSATGMKAICVAPTGTGVTNGIASPTAANDEGITTKRYQPVIRNVRADGVPIADQPWPSMTAAQAGNCNPVPAGTVVRISDDTAVGACTDAGGDGVLDGGGTSSSVCKCIAATNLWGPL